LIIHGRYEKVRESGVVRSQAVAIHEEWIEGTRPLSSESSENS